MKDVQKAVAERASHPISAPAGSSFETERQRQRTAVGRQFDALDGTRIRKISALSDADSGGSQRKLRVAAYCRVSIDDLDQALSIHMQKRVYREKIKANPEWIYAGTYVDNGFSGTNTTHRPGFLKLIDDCRAGKIDMIITKAVSRFARNLLDCIGYIEELSNLNPPVRVFFEQEGLDTSVQTSGIILFVLAMVAEEESHMKSEAMLLSLEWRFSRGRFLTPALFGYDKIEVPDGFGGKRKMLDIYPNGRKYDGYCSTVSKTEDSIILRKHTEFLPAYSILCSEKNVFIHTQKWANFEQYAVCSKDVEHISFSYLHRGEGELFAPYCEALHRVEWGEQFVQIPSSRLVGKQLHDKLLKAFVGRNIVGRVYIFDGSVIDRLFFDYDSKPKISQKKRIIIAVDVLQSTGSLFPNMEMYRRYLQTHKRYALILRNELPQKYADFLKKIYEVGE